MRTMSDQQVAVASLEARLATLEQMLFGGRWMSTPAAAERLGCSPQTVRRLIGQGRCAARQWRGRWEVDPAWVAAELIARSGTCARPVALHQEEVA
jgi:hypothetical protein